MSIQRGMTGRKITDEEDKSRAQPIIVVEKVREIEINGSAFLEINIYSPMTLRKPSVSLPRLRLGHITGYIWLANAHPNLSLLIGISYILKMLYTKIALL